MDRCSALLPDVVVSVTVVIHVTVAVSNVAVSVTVAVSALYVRCYENTKHRNMHITR